MLRTLSEKTSERIKQECFVLLPHFHNAADDSALCLLADKGER